MAASTIIGDSGERGFQVRDAYHDLAPTNAQRWPISPSLSTQCVNNHGRSCSTVRKSCPTPPEESPGWTCDCGWPYTLLVPRGDAGAGASYLLAVIVTDTSIDMVDPDTSYGSMSFCEAIDRYPDAREMGYPFSRQFTLSILETLENEPQMQAVTLSVVHEDDAPVG